MSEIASGFAPLAAATGKPVQLAMQQLWLGGQILPAGARLVARHVFQSAEDRPLEVVYAFPLPRDAAMRRFRITGDGFEAHSELKPTEEAIKSYEAGVAAGSLSALARQYGDGLVNLTIGNLRPKEKVSVYLELLAGVELRDDGFRFRFPFTLAPAYHPRMRVAANAREGEIELPADEFGDLILPPFRQDAAGLHEIGFELHLPAGMPLAEVASPSHAIRVTIGAKPAVALASASDLPDRDLILDARFAENKAQTLAGAAENGKRSFAILVPSTMFGAAAVQPRRTAILLDRSGSMQGAPIAQARKAVEACLAALRDCDSFALLAFGDRVESMSPKPQPATLECRDAARAFLKRIDAQGGTALAKGIQAAADALGNQGDILILTDGQVFGTETILAGVRGRGIRLFCLGIGSASQDRFLALLARETGGLSRFLAVQERVDLAGVDLFASMSSPLASGVTAKFAQPEPPETVFAGAPLLLFGEIPSDSSAPIGLSWQGGKMSIPLPAGDAETGEALRLLRGSRLITDYESRYPAEENAGILARRRHTRARAHLLELSQTYGLASREMSLVAVVKRQGDRRGQLPETRVVPVAMPRDTGFQAYFANVGFSPDGSITGAFPPMPRLMAAMPSDSPRYRFCIADDKPGLIDLAAMLQPDGGMPGATPEERAARTVAAIFAFAAAGHTRSSGAFRAHVERLVKFLKSFKPESAGEAPIDKALSVASIGVAPPGQWLALARKEGACWNDIAEALACS